MSFQPHCDNEIIYNLSKIQDKPNTFLPWFHHSVVNLRLGKESNLIQFELKKHVQVRTATSYPGSSPTVVFKSEGMLIFRAEKMSQVQYLWSERGSEIIFFFYKFSISGFTLNWYYSNVLYHQRIKLLAFHISPFLKINDNLIFPAKLEL